MSKSLNKKVAIIGGGASGLFSAIFCAKNGCEVVVFEQNSRCGKKILVSGNGRCNITNKNILLDDYYSQNPLFVKDALNLFGFDEFEKFTQSIGLLLDVKEDGRVYPLSNESKGVLSSLLSYADSLGVVIQTDTKITNIKKLLDDYDSVIVATGSKAGEHLGGNDDGHRFGAEFGHSIIQPFPSLVQLHLNSNIAHKMSGVKTTAEVTLLINNKKETSLYGDILFTNYGISGFAILDISQNASVALVANQKVDIAINLLPNFNIQKLSSHIIKLSKSMPNLSLVDVLVGLVPQKIATSIIQELSITHIKYIKNIDTKLSKKIANQLLNWRFEVEDTHGFRHAEVSGGGINTDEIDSKTMMSKKQKNLYFCGEVLDVVGKRGGYNFAFAWASAYSCAKSVG